MLFSCFVFVGNVVKKKGCNGMFRSNLYISEAKYLGRLYFIQILQGLYLP